MFFLASICTVPATPSPAPPSSVSSTHAQFSLQRCPNLGGGMPGCHFDMLFAADRFRIITSRLPGNFLISLSLIVSLALPGWGMTPHPHSYPHPPLPIYSFSPCSLPLTDLTAVVLNFLPGYFQRIHLVLLRVRGWWEQCQWIRHTDIKCLTQKHTWARVMFFCWYSGGLRTSSRWIHFWCRSRKRKYQ